MQSAAAFLVSASLHYCHFHSSVLLSQILSVLQSRDFAPIVSVARVAKLGGKVCLHLVILIKITVKLITFCCRHRGISQFPFHPLSRMNRWPVLAPYESKCWDFKLLLLKLLLAFCQIQVSWGFNFVVRRRIEERIMISCQALEWLLLLGMLKKVSVEFSWSSSLPYDDASSLPEDPALHTPLTWGHTESSDPSKDQAEASLRRWYFAIGSNCHDLLCNFTSKTWNTLARHLVCFRSEMVFDSWKYHCLWDLL